MPDATPVITPPDQDHPPPIMPPADPGTLVAPPAPPPITAPAGLAVVAPVAPAALLLAGFVVRVGNLWPAETERTYRADAAGKRSVAVNTVGVVGTLTVPDPGVTADGVPNAYSVGLAATLTPVSDPCKKVIGDSYYDAAAFPYPTVLLYYSRAAASDTFAFYVRGPSWGPPPTRIPAGVWAVQLAVRAVDVLGAVVHDKVYPLGNVTLAG